MTADTALQVTSFDGTPIGVTRRGSGPALIMVHGTTSNKERWAKVVDALSAEYTLYMIDRRGRGTSGDAPLYAIEREGEDVCAVLAAIPQPRVFLLGHSYGAIAVLQAALAQPHRVAGLSLYEAPLREASTAEEEAVAADVQQEIDAGRLEPALITFYQRILKLQEADIARLKATPAWPHRVALAHTIAREIRGSLFYRAPWLALSALDVPVQLLLGELSLPRFADATARLEKTLPDARLTVLAGQAHNAIDNDSAVYAAAVLTFLRSLSAPESIGTEVSDLVFEPLHNRPGYLIRRAHQICNELFINACGELEITPNQYSVLFALDRSGTLDMASIGRLTSLDRTTTALVVRILGERRFVEKRRNTTDQRKYSIKLTPLGKTSFDRATQLAAPAIDQLLAPFSKEEGAELVGLLQRFIKHFK